MASPDFSQYIDLTIYDIDAFQVYEDAIEYARIAVPEFSPRPGTLEEAIMQAIAYNTSLLSTQINRLPDGLMEGMARLAGVERREATFASGNAVFEVFDDNGVLIPQGTVVSYETIDDDIVTAYLFETTADLVIPPLATTGSVGIQALNAGVYPALLAGQELQLVSPAPGVVSVELEFAIFIGTNAETDIEYFNRATQHFASLSAALVTKTQIANYVRSSYPNVGALHVFDLTNGDALTGDMAWSALPAGGQVTIVASSKSGGIYSEGVVEGISLSEPEMEAISQDVQDKSVAGLTVTVIAPNPIEFTVNIGIVIEQGFSGAEVRNTVDDYVTNLFSALGYDFSGSIIKNRVISAVANLEGVAYVSSITITPETPSEVTVEEITGNIFFINKHDTPVATVEVTSA